MNQVSLQLLNVYISASEQGGFYGLLNATRYCMTVVEAGGTSISRMQDHEMEYNTR